MAPAEVNVTSLRRSKMPQNVKLNSDMLLDPLDAIEERPSTAPHTELSTSDRELLQQESQISTSRVRQHRTTQSVRKHQRVERRQARD